MSCQTFVSPCLPVLMELPSASVDLVITSPPYDHQPRYGSQSQPYGRAWYENYFISVCGEIYRILKPTGSFVLNYRSKRGDEGQGRGTLQFEIPLWMIDLGFTFAEDFVWGKPTPPPGVYKRVLKEGFEYCFQFTKGPSWKFFPEQALVPSRIPLAEREYRANEQPEAQVRRRGATDRSRRRLTSYPDMARPSTLIMLEPDFGRNPTQHPARFPVALPEFFIKLMTEPGDLVLDPFAGTGTTAVAAQRLGRYWIIIEEQAKYLAALEARLQ